MRYLTNKVKGHFDVKDYYFDGFHEMKYMIENGYNSAVELDKDRFRKNERSFREHTYNSNTTAGNSLSWYGIDWQGSVKATQAKIEETIEYGWFDKLDEFNKLIDSFLVEHKELVSYRRKRKRVRKEAGHDINIHQVYNGNMARAWESYESHYIKTGKKRNIKIGYVRSHNCGDRY